MSRKKWSWLIRRSHERDMRDMRNFVVHEYFGISDKIIWDTVQNNLPPLINLLKPLLGPQVLDENS